MDGILNSDELDALRAAVEQDVLPEEAGGDSDSVILDGAELPRFRFGESRIGGLQREERISSVFSKAAQSLETRLSDILESPVTVAVTWLEETRFSNFVETFEVDARELAAMQFRVPGSTTSGLISLEPEVVEKLVEGLMGGAAMVTSPTGRRATHRSVTELDLRVSRRWVGGFLQDLGVAWNPGEPLSFPITSTDSNGAAARAVADTSPVIAGLLEIALGRRTVGMIGVVLPQSAADSMGAEGTDTIVEPEPVGPGPLRPAVPDFEVDVEVAIARKRLSVRELLALSVGDVLFMDPRQMTTGYVQGVPKFTGTPGAHNGNKAVQINQVIGRNADVS